MNKLGMPIRRRHIARSLALIEAVEPRLLYTAAHTAVPLVTHHRPTHSVKVSKHPAAAVKTATNIASTIPALPTSWSATPDNVAATDAGAATPASTNSPLGLTPTQMRSAYGLGAYGSSPVKFNGVQGDGTGQTIAIVDAYNDPTALNDLNAFSTQFNLPVFNGLSGPTFQQLNQNGLTSPLPANSGSTGWSIEESLDIEWAHVMAPQANIVLLEASDTGIGLYTADVSAAKIAGVVAVSNSWSGDEFNGETAYDSYFTTPLGHKGGSATAGGTLIAGGVSFLFSTGDHGAYGSPNAVPSQATTIEPQYPAASPNVIAVGGTSLTVTNNAWAGESAWGHGTSSGSSGGSGGAISQYESQPSYQSGIVKAYSTTQRTTPDISLEADPNAPTGSAPVYDSYDLPAYNPSTMTGGYWGEYGGTSLSCPMLAGIIAVADQGRAVNGLGSLDSSASATTGALPRIYSFLSSDFHDITSGSIGPAPTYSAATGYDLTTGVGSAIASSMIPDLVGVSLSSALSSKVQGSAGTFGLSLDVRGNASNATIDPRQFASGDQMILTFSQKIHVNGATGTVSPGNFTTTNGVISGASVSGNVLTLTFSNLSDQSVVSVGLTGVTDIFGGALNGTKTLYMRALEGASSQNTDVSVVDFQAVKNQFLQTVNSSNFLDDVNRDGSIDVVDFQDVKNHLFDSVS